MPPEAAASEYASITVATLGDFMDRGYRLSCWCPTCTRSAWLDLEALAARVGRDFEPDYNVRVRTTKARGRLPVRCQRCGGAHHSISVHAPSTLR